VELTGCWNSRRLVDRPRVIGEGFDRGTG